MFSEGISRDTNGINFFFNGQSFGWNFQTTSLAKVADEEAKNDTFI